MVSGVGGVILYGYKDRPRGARNACGQGGRSGEIDGEQARFKEKTPATANRGEKKVRYSNRTAEQRGKNAGPDP